MNKNEKKQKTGINTVTAKKIGLKEGDFTTSPDTFELKQNLDYLFSLLTATENKTDISAPVEDEKNAEDFVVGMKTMDFCCGQLERLKTTGLEPKEAAEFLINLLAINIQTDMDRVYTTGGFPQNSPNSFCRGGTPFGEDTTTCTTI